MSIIYQPGGRAREYAPWAANLYKGCPHGCKYPCYAATLSVKQRWFPSVAAFHAHPEAREGALEQFAREAASHARKGERLLVQLGFLTDPYQPLEKELGLTREAIQALKAPVPGDMFGPGVELQHNAQILTKAGELAMRDLELLASWPGNLFGISLTTLDSEKAARVEPFAALPRDRCASAAAAKMLGITTWCSLEPTYWPAESLKCMEAADEFIDCFAVGKLNHAKPPSPIDYRAYKGKVVELAQRQGRKRVQSPADAKPGEKSYVLKVDLLEAA
ncbi:MAG: hypothetical protein K9K66_04370 [Desulfarculaceae bacterium]|nr:hypothetical protein [Desulfarculaceae bacterium]MCF8073278.1 hypothetical protein [Desulfarculaceae bacterium]MCF8100874.1 hypothetical protein [Desulfarculaceae bacterium]MCF8116670.1 hypothetical protein [Desulfarculaceae bacterium]